MPVMGLIFLRHAYSRYLKVKPEVEEKTDMIFKHLLIASKNSGFPMHARG
jgi:hypothetical protein